MPVNIFGPTFHKMISFQLDENINSKKLAKRCNTTFPGRVCRFPPCLIGATDPEMLQQVLSGTKPLITLDRSLPYEHAHCIPEEHPGIIVIFDDSIPSAMTAKRAQDIIEIFKAKISDLSLICWKNHIFEISQTSFSVYVIKKNQLIQIDAAIACNPVVSDLASISNDKTYTD